MAPVEFVNRLDEIVATLEDVSATGLNLTSDGSTIVVTGPHGGVEGVQTSRGTNQIAWQPLQLATDGSADGVYTATVTLSIVATDWEYPRGINSRLIRRSLK